MSEIDYHGQPPTNCRSATDEDGLSTNTKSCSEAGATRYDVFGDTCAQLLDLFSKAVLVMGLFFTIWIGLRMNHFNALFVPRYGWIIGAVSLLFTGTILVVGVIDRLGRILKQNQRGKVTLFQVFFRTTLLVVMTMTTMYCAAVSIAGMKNLQSNITASNSSSAPEMAGRE